MRRLTLLFLLAALVAAPAASAKEIMAVTACGPERCVTSDDEDVTGALMNGGSPTQLRKDTAGVVLLRASVGDGVREEELASWMSAWEPRAGLLIGEDGTWMRLPAAAGLAIEELTAGLSTYPPSILERLGSAEGELPTTKPAESPAVPAPAAPEPEAFGGSDWVLLLIPAAAVLGFGIVALLRRRRPGGGAPRPATQ